MKKRKLMKQALLALALVFSAPAFAQFEEEPAGEPVDGYFSDDYTGYTDTETADEYALVDMEQAGEEDLYDFTTEESLDPSALEGYDAG